VGEALAVGWFTNAGNDARVLVAFSSGAGTAFSPPIRVDTGDPIGRAKVVLTQAGDAWVAWVERSEGNARVMLRGVSSNGTLSQPLALATPEQTNMSGFPQMVSRDGELIVAWSTPPSTTQPPRVRVARAVVTAR
jgi:hypothetical protein